MQVRWTVLGETLKECNSRRAVGVSRCGWQAQLEIRSEPFPSLWN